MGKLIDDLTTDTSWLIKKLGLEGLTSSRMCTLLIKDFDEAITELDPTLVTKSIMEVLTDINDTYFTNKFIGKLYSNHSLCANLFVYELLTNAEYNKRYYAIRHFKTKITEVYEELIFSDSAYDGADLDELNRMILNTLCKPTLDFIDQEYSNEELDYIGVLHDENGDDLRGHFIDDTIDKVVTYTTLTEIMFRQNMDRNDNTFNKEEFKRLSSKLDKLSDNLSVLDGCIVYLNTIIFKEPLIHVDNDDISLDEDVDRAFNKFVKETEKFYKNAIEYETFDLKKLLDGTQVNFKRISEDLTDLLEVELLSASQIHEDDKFDIHEDAYTLETFISDVGSIVKHHIGLISSLRCLITLSTVKFKHEEDAVVTLQTIMLIVGYISAILGIPDGSSMYPKIKIKRPPLLKYLEEKINE